MTSATSLILAAKPAAESSSAWVAPTIVISIVALAVSLATFILAGRRVRLDRQRQVFAEALEAVMTYREYAFIVYRRNAEERAKEQQRISSDLSQLQAKLNGFEGRLRVEDPYVGARYAKLVAATRRIAGSMITDAWNREPAALDSKVHNPGWYFTELKPFDDAYLRSAADHLGWLYAPARRKLREWFGREEAQNLTPQHSDRRCRTAGLSIPDYLTRCTSSRSVRARAGSGNSWRTQGSSARTSLICSKSYTSAGIPTSSSTGTR